MTKIKINRIDDIKKFINGCTKNFSVVDIWLRQGRQMINTKSILGVYSLDLSSPVEVTIDSDDEEIIKDFNDFIEPWIVSDNF